MGQTLALAHASSFPRHLTYSKLLLRKPAFTQSLAATCRLECGDVDQAEVSEPILFQPWQLQEDIKQLKNGNAKR
eukprot:6481618-Amphidinium_carterae.1